MRIAAIDLGTVSSRLLCAEMRDGQIATSTKHTVITDLGERVDAAGVFAPAAIDRVVRACIEFVREAREFDARYVCCTLTSAARDVSNGDELLDRLRGLGLAPQVIPGEVEARLTFYGVAHDFAGERITVADSGGGSTELVVGRASDGDLELDRAESINVGCRRVTERFFTGAPPRAGELDEAAAWARAQFEPYWAGLADRPERLVAVGGTVTTLVAMVHELAVYDSHFVHLRDLTIEQIENAVERLGSLTIEQIAGLAGVQAKRAPVILAGAVIMRELMRAGGYGRLTVSENSLLAGAAATIYETVVNGRAAIGWSPELSSR